MIVHDTVSELVEREPFQPFRIYMSDGHAYEVVNPSLVVPMASMLFIALEGDRWKFLNYSQMTRIESISVAA